MQVTASMVKELRERTGAGMMECKKALTDAKGDPEAAIEIMRKAGLANADKKSSRVAAEGIIGLRLSEDGKSAVMVEVNCETDFVAKGDDFGEFVELVCQRILTSKPSSVDELASIGVGGGGSATIESFRQEMVVRIGENIQVRRFLHMSSEDGKIGFYSHGGRIGVLVELTGGNEVLAKDIAMHIAASRPVCISEKDMPEEHMAKEREILIAQAKDSGKPNEIIEKMVEGRLKKYLAEVTLLGQVFVKDPDISIGKLLKSADVKVNAFKRFEVGEGIEKKSENFADEVMAQIKGG